MKPLKPLTQYGRMAERHWREFLPRMVSALLEAEERTDAELDQLRRHFLEQGLTAQQAHDRAWEMVRERYLLLPPES